MLVQFAPLVLIFVVFYFLLIRPQQKKMKDHKTMLEAVRRGDRVVTGGGILGTVIKVGPDDEMQVEIAEGVRVRCLRSTLSAVLAKTEPAGKAGEGSGKPGTDAPAESAAGGDGPMGFLNRLLGRK